MQTAKLINLPLPERMHAMDLLWSSLSQGAQAQDIVPDWHKKIILARVKDLRAGKGASASLEQTKKISRNASKQQCAKTSLYADIHSITVFAGIHAKAYRGIYRTFSAGFPFGIYYVMDDRLVTVVAILDTRRNPRTIRFRISDEGSQRR